MLCEQKIISLYTAFDTFLDAAYGTAATGISPLDDSEGCGRRHDRGGGFCEESQETRLKEAEAYLPRDPSMHFSPKWTFLAQNAEKISFLHFF